MGREVEYPSAGHLYLDGHLAKLKGRQSHSAEPYTFRHTSVSDSSHVPFLFSVLDVTGEKKALLYLELIVMDAPR